MRLAHRCAPPRPRVLHFTAALISSMLVSSAGFAQDNSRGVTVGQQAYEMYAENSIESVNASNGNLNLQIPLLSYKQRGSLPPVTLRIIYNADNWRLENLNTSGGNVGQPQPAFFNFVGGGAVFSVSPFFQGGQASATYGSAASGGQYTISEPVVIDPSGAEHLMAPTTPTTSQQGPYRTLDASGYLRDAEFNHATNTETTTLLDANGIGYRDGGGLNFSDPNGNVITATPRATSGGVGSPGPIASYTDSVGPSPADADVLSILSAAAGLPNTPVSRAARLSADSAYLLLYRLPCHLAFYEHSLRDRPWFALRRDLLGGPAERHAVDLQL